MTNRVFLAGASGVIGRALIPLLVRDGYQVIGTTRRFERADLIRKLGAEPVIVDALEPDALREAVIDSVPEIVIHQLTDLPPGLNPALMGEGRERNARVRIEGTRNLVAASIAARSTYIVVQSVAFVYAEGRLPHPEEDPLDVRAEGTSGLTARAVSELERQVLEAPIPSLVLRFGRLYGPGTGFDSPPPAPALHVLDAAEATALAVRQGATGLFNLAEDDTYADTRRARGILGWRTMYAQQRYS